MRGSSRNDLCRTFVEQEALELLARAMLAINSEHPIHAGRAADLLLLFSCADTVVKARMATTHVLPSLMKVLGEPHAFDAQLTLKVRILL